MLMLDNNAADILSLDAGEVFIAGRYNSLIPFMQQIFEGSEFDSKHITFKSYLLSFVGTIIIIVFRRLCRVLCSCADKKEYSFRCVQFGKFKR